MSDETDDLWGALEVRKVQLLELHAAEQELRTCSHSRRLAHVSSYGLDLGEEGRHEVWLKHSRGRHAARNLRDHSRRRERR